MQSKKLNTGVIFTNSSCIGCNRCISGCVAVGANVVVKKTKRKNHVVAVDPNKCILCGNCVSQCVHKARTYRDDTDGFFKALAEGKEISILVSPTLLTNYEKQYHNILGYLKHLGVRHIYNTAYGGDLMVWVYMNFIKNFGLSGVISQSCPVITNYIEKYKPELLPYLMPVQSPALCTGIYVNDYLKNKDKLAYISPCIASKYEIDDVNTYHTITYNVTIERLMERLSSIDLTKYTATDEAEYGLGALMPMAGGLSDNIERYIGFNEVLIQTGGPDHIFPYFDHYCTEIQHGETLPFLVDVLGCSNGCNFGTGTNCGAALRNEMTFSAHRLKEKAYRSGIMAGRTPEERLEFSNQRFKGLELSSFVRQYDATRGITRQELTDGQLDKVFSSMYMLTDKQRHTDCGACGYQTCLGMATAIATGINSKENCINYAKECIRQETEKINTLLSEISSMNKELKRATQLKSNFLANMSHEIRTPMNAIIGMAEMALRGDLPPEERGYLQQIKASGRSLLAIINDILDFSKIESGKMEINMTDYKVMSIISDTINVIMTRIGDKNISLLVDADPNIPRVLTGDDIRIKQVLVNLANNAVKFTESGFVKVQLNHERCDGGILLKIFVSDSGIGIKPEDIEKLFSSFQQVDSKRNRNVEGTGLGLAISREFVHLMQGDVAIRSTYGEGSTFSFWIPQAVVEDCPSVSIKRPGTVATASLIAQTYLREGFLESVAQLPAIHNTDCCSVQQLLQTLAQGAEFAFVDYPLWNSELDRYAQEHPDKQMVVILDPRSETLYVPYVTKLHQPAYCVNIAAAINGDTTAIYDTEQSQDFRFEAPDAHILVVDDNAINLTVAKGLLSPFKMQITCASSAREAIALISQIDYDIIFMDHMMPEMDGIEATHVIRQMADGKYRNLPIVALTANAINNAREFFLRKGMNDFVAKPIEMRDITARLRHWLPEVKLHELGAAGGPLTEQQSGKSPAEQQTISIDGVDVPTGIRLSGSVELYKKILCDYLRVIEKKAQIIAEYEAAEDLPAYTIEVHALKSASRLIGANSLADHAARLEAAGKSGDSATIHAETPDLLDSYRGFISKLAPFGPQEVLREQVKKSLDEIQELLDRLVTALEDFDLDGARLQLEQLQGCSLAEDGAKRRTALAEQIDSMEYDQAAELVKSWRAALTTE